VAIPYIEESMFNISSIYPKSEGCEFDFDYDDPKLESSYVAMCHYYFDSLKDFMAAFAPHAEELQGDIANYTNIEPIIQINEVQISK
jgi:hypothetical protein